MARKGPSGSVIFPEDAGQEKCDMSGSLTGVAVYNKNNIVLKNFTDKSDQIHRPEYNFHSSLPCCEARSTVGSVLIINFYTREAVMYNNITPLIQNQPILPVYLVVKFTP